MNSKPDISVVIVNWNTRDLLRDCLNSVFAEPTGLEMEVFVVDNASSDGSPRMVREIFPDVRLIANQKNVGFARANNQAFPSCNADKILLLNSDTIVAGSALRVLSDFLDEHPEAGAIAPKLEQSQAVDILGCGRFLTLRTAFNHWLFFARLFPSVRAFEGIYFYRGAHDDRVREVDWVSGACMLVRRSLIQQVGPLSDKWFMYAEDQEWCARIKEAGWRIFHLPKAIVEHRHGTSFEKNPEVSVLPLRAGRELFAHLTKPSRAKLFIYDLIVIVGLILRAIGDFLRSFVGDQNLRKLRRRRSRKFLSDAQLMLAGAGARSN